MEKLVIKVTFNSKNPMEAELIEILKKKKNKAAHLKMAALYFWEILETQTAREEYRRQTTEGYRQEMGDREQTTDYRRQKTTDRRQKKTETEEDGAQETEYRLHKTDDIDLGNTFTEWK